MPLELKSTHDTTITIDDEPVLTHIKRLTKTEAIAFERDFLKHGRPRGTQEMTDEERDARSTAARQFMEDSITAYVSVESGQIIDDGRPVASGEDLIRTFAARADVLGAFYQSIYTENFLGKAQKKILNAQPFFAPGSERSIASAAGAAPASTAGSAGSSSSATGAGAMGGSDSDPSGPKVH